MEPDCLLHFLQVFTTLAIRGWPTSAQDFLLPLPALAMTHFVKSPLPNVVTCPYCKAKLYWVPPIDEGLVAHPNCPRCKQTILIIDNVACFDPSARKPPQRAR
jgi:hypothetical protein